MGEKYESSCEDELAWKEIDQLHEATLQISRQCFDYKKLCVGFIGVACGLIIKLTDNNLDYSLFVVGGFISLSFWIADANAYYFQKSVRKIMDSRMNLLAENNDVSSKRVIKSPSWGSAYFNQSMLLYYAMIFFSVLGCVCVFMNWIK